MPRKTRTVRTESEQLRDRALWFRQLADGAGDPQFAIKLNALSEEYKASAELVDASASSPK